MQLMLRSERNQRNRVRDRRVLKTEDEYEYICKTSKNAPIVTRTLTVSTFESGASLYVGVFVQTVSSIFYNLNIVKNTDTLWKGLEGRKERVRDRDERIEDESRRREESQSRNESRARDYASREDDADGRGREKSSGREQCCA